jgi:hypothetical protein
MEDEIRGMTRKLARRERMGTEEESGITEQRGMGGRKTTLRGGGGYLRAEWGVMLITKFTNLGIP